MKKRCCTILAVTLMLVSHNHLRAQGESSTYFNIFVPPNAEQTKRNVSLIVTAVFDSTTFEIIDDGMDGDTDDSKAGILSRGQSYVLYIADNGINDDARYASGGVLKQDGDYFIIHSNKNVLVSQSTNSDWQHDFVPAIGQKGIGERFFVYAPPVSSSKRDLNTFIHEDSTLVTIKKISTAATTATGYTNIDYENAVVVGTRLLNRGQDIIYFNTLGRDVMETGHTYMVEATKPVTLQYGALYGNERDGGGNVPSSNGSSSGELFYFGVPYQSAGEQEIRIVSWDNTNTIKLERYNAGNWVTVKTWTLNQYGFSDWVGKSNGNASYPTVFRITTTPGKRVSVFEANWLETGSPGTSDIGSMMTSENGTSAGQKFIAYMAPPGNEYNVRDPFTGTLFSQQLTHLYISSRTGAHVTVKDAYSNGAEFNRTYTINPERYIDCALTLQEWKNIYNGTGGTSGPERPYLVVESDQPISIFNTNFNDNWMAYLGTSQRQEFSLNTITPSSAVIPGDTSVVTTQVVVKTASAITDATASVVVEGNIQIVSSTLTSTSGTNVSGTISNNSKTATFNDVPSITSGDTYIFQTIISATVADNKGNLYSGNSVGIVTAQVTGTVDGVNLQAVSSNGVFINSANFSQLMFTPSTDPAWANLLTDSWTVGLVDYNNDNWDDIFIAERDASKPNYLYRNNADKTFTHITTGTLVTDKRITVAGAWADIDNDNDLDVLIVNNTQRPNDLYINNGNGTFTKSATPGFVQQPGYYHSGSWIDYDNDGLLDLFLCNYWPTKLNELWHNDGNGNFSLQTNSPLSQVPGDAVSSTWADYDNDGLMDLFLPNNKGGKNLLFHNDGNGRFTPINNVISQDGGFSVASCWGDIDGDGFADLFVSNASGKNNDLYLNTGNGNFQKVVSGQVVNSQGNFHGCSFADIDNDSDLDLYINDDKGAKMLYTNDGNGIFNRVINEVIAANYGQSMGHAWSDLDKDGDLDLFSVTHSGERNWLFWNNGNSNHWLGIKLVGTESNKSAIGARMRVKANGRWSQLQVSSQSGIGGQSSSRNHFGLGTATQADSIIIYWPSGSTQTLTNVPANQYMIIPEQTGKKVEAQFFLDTNGNCIRDAGEIYLANQPVRILPLNTTTITDAGGSIHSRLTPGTYTLSFINTNSYNGNCSGNSFDIAVAHEDVFAGEIPMMPVCNCSDAAILIYTPAMRRGFGNNCNIQISNEGSQPTDILHVKVTVPQKLDIKNATPAFAGQLINNGTVQYSWDIPSLQPGEQTHIVIRDSVNLNYRIGDEISLTTEVSTSVGETNQDNNKKTYSYEVVGAIDPNMITASPRGFGDQRLVETTQTITYQVQFENIGNYPTSFVTIIDTLPDILDVTTLKNIISSHGPVQTQVTGHVATFYLPAAILPPNTEDSLLSRGYVQFNLGMVEGITGVFNNRASIVFDYSEPVSTNTIMHNAFDNTNAEPGTLMLFPNPATNNYTNATLRMEGESSAIIEELSLFDTRGILHVRKTGQGPLATLDVTNLPSGVYIIRATTADNKHYMGKLFVTR